MQRRGVFSSIITVTDKTASYSGALKCIKTHNEGAKHPIWLIKICSRQLQEKHFAPLCERLWPGPGAPSAQICSISPNGAKSSCILPCFPLAGAHIDMTLHHKRPPLCTKLPTSRGEAAAKVPITAACGSLITA